MQILSIGNEICARSKYPCSSTVRSTRLKFMGQRGIACSEVGFLVIVLLEGREKHFHDFVYMRVHAIRVIIPVSKPVNMATHVAVMVFC